jgi:uncharacterized protein YkwD
VERKAQGVRKAARHENGTEYPALTREQAGLSVSTTRLTCLKTRIRFPDWRFPAFLLVGLLCLACAGCMESSQTQLASQRSAADRTEGRGRASASKRQNGVWHHFGERASPSSEQAPAKGVWHLFGSAERNPADGRVADGSAVERSSAGNRTVSDSPASSGSGPEASPPKSIPRRHYSSRDGDPAKEMFAMINADRLDRANAAEGGGSLRPLRWNEKLAALARAHSRDMIRQGYFDHVDPEGRSPGDRMREAGIHWVAEGENIAVAGSAAEAEAEFMNEPRFQHNHRWNILNRRYTDVGVGVVRGPDGRYYVTQEFMERGPGS